VVLSRRCQAGSMGPTCTGSHRPRLGRQGLGMWSDGCGLPDASGQSGEGSSRELPRSSEASPGGQPPSDGRATPLPHKPSPPRTTPREAEDRVGLVRRHRGICDRDVAGRRDPARHVGKGRDRPTRRGRSHRGALARTRRSVAPRPPSRGDGRENAPLTRFRDHRWAWGHRGGAGVPGGTQRVRKRERERYL
jgi:hypothetical protein